MIRHKHDKIDNNDDNFATSLLIIWNLRQQRLGFVEYLKFVKKSSAGYPGFTTKM